MFRRFYLRFILRPLGRLIGTERWEEHVAAHCHCIDCGHRYVVVMRSTRFAELDDWFPIPDLFCEHCHHELVVPDREPW